MRSKGNFTKEFKLKILEEIKHRPLAEVCREYDIHPNTVSRWKSEYKKNPEAAFSGQGNLWKDEAKVARYERLIGRLYAGIDLLKKSIALQEKLEAEERREKKSAR